MMWKFWESEFLCEYGFWLGSGAVFLIGTYLLSLTECATKPTLQTRARLSLVGEPAPKQDTSTGDTLDFVKKCKFSAFGKAIKIVDGDTFDFLDNNSSETRVRLKHIDAPERGQPFGQRAKSALHQLIYAQNVRVDWDSADRNQRILGEVFIGDTLVNRFLVANGLAWNYNKYSTDEQMRFIEQTAREKKVGLWVDESPCPPWDWRKKRCPN